MDLNTVAALIDLDQAHNVNIGGHGGKEREIAALLSKWSRDNHMLYDFSFADLFRVEVKKQLNTQWFDIGKYHNLSQHNRQIVLMFLNHKDGKIISICLVTLGDFIDFMCENYSKDGWTTEVMATCSCFKSKYPTMQTKVKANIRDVFGRMPKNIHLNLKIGC